MRISGFFRLPDGRNWLWGKLGFALVGRAMLSKSLMQLSADGWGFTASTLVVWPDSSPGVYRLCLLNSLWPYGLYSTRFLCPWGFSREEYWIGLPCPPPENLPHPGIKPVSLMYPALAAGSFTTSTTWEALAPIGSMVALRLGDDGLNQRGGAEDEKGEQIARRWSGDQKTSTAVLLAARLWWSGRGPDRWASGPDGRLTSFTLTEERKVGEGWRVGWQMCKYEVLLGRPAESIWNSVLSESLEENLSQR